MPCIVPMIITKLKRGTASSPMHCIAMGKKKHSSIIIHPPPFSSTLHHHWGCLSHKLVGSVETRMSTTTILLILIIALRDLVAQWAQWSWAQRRWWLALSESGRLLEEACVRWFSSMFYNPTRNQANRREEILLTTCTGWDTSCRWHFCARQPSKILFILLRWWNSVPTVIQ